MQAAILALFVSEFKQKLIDGEQWKSELVHDGILIIANHNHQIYSWGRIAIETRYAGFWVTARLYTTCRLEKYMPNAQ